MPATLVWACQPPGVRPFPTALDQLTAAGDATVYDATSAAYGLPAPNLTAADVTKHVAGDRGFSLQFVSAPAPQNPGLGPIFNNNSCRACHHADGGGRPAEDGSTSDTILFRVSVPGAGPDGGPVPVPGYGLQIQHRAVFGVPPEASITTHYAAVAGTYADGTAYTLQRPTFKLIAPYKPLPADLLVSPRVTPPVFGLGLLEAVPDATILALADPDDKDGDGISGRANMVTDSKAGALRLGRFGWKANTPNIEQQVGAAYQQDMGITNDVYGQESSIGQTQLPATAAARVELTGPNFDDVVFYTRSLGVPARRDVAAPSVLHGADLFQSAQCAACHQPTLVTGDSPFVPALAHQVIHPYTDLLVHDLGPDLADNRPDFLASGSEWRTTPLWGLGLRERVEGHNRLLHDGRANGPAEAILWHGGEAAASKQAFLKMSAAERADLLAFLGSL